MIIPVILCSATGAALWPSSRLSHAKQFVELDGRNSLFQNTLRRVSGPQFTSPLLIADQECRFLVEDQTKQLGIVPQRTLLEPVPRGTASSILIAALSIEKTPDALMLICQSDRKVSDDVSFCQTVMLAASAAQNRALVVIGARFGGLASDVDHMELEGQAEPGRALKVTGFNGLSNPEAALHVLANTGTYLFRVDDIIKAFQTYAPELVDLCRQALERGRYDLDALCLDNESYESLPVASIEGAILETADNTVAVQLETDWSDLEGWERVHDIMPSDENGVTCMGTATAVNCENTLLRSEEDSVRLVGLGLKNIAAVATRDAVLVADMDCATDVGETVVALQHQGVAQAAEYPRFHRPWGWYETLCLGDRFQVKRIMVKPGGILSLQSHHHRAEHWVVVAGTARVTVGDDVRLLSENENIYVPLGAVHRMENPGKLPMYLIEVQTGAYLGEDDIVRYEDVYNRT